MKKTVFLALVFAVVMSSMAYAGSLTDKVDQLIDTNQTRLERTYNLRDMHPNQFALRFGPPLGFGLEYSYNMNQTLAIVIGAGSAGGFDADLGVNWYVLNTPVAPVVSAGVADVANAVCIHVGAGVDVQLDNAFGIQLGLDWTKSVANSSASGSGSFQTFSYSDAANVLFLNGGVSFRM